MNKRLSTKRLLFILIILAFASLVLCVGIGPVSISPLTVAKVIASRLPLIGEKITPTWTDTEYIVIISTRLPRVLLGFVVGCALAFSGTSMQSLVRNELADPYILGVSYGAAAFATIGMITGIFSFMGIYQNAINGCIGAFLSIFFVFIYSLSKGHINIDQLLLGGIAIALFTKAIVKIIALTNVQVFLHANSAFWTQGGLAGSRWDYLQWPMLMVVCCFAFLLLHYRSLNALLCGEETAQTLGIPVGWMQKALIMATSVLIGITVSVSGGIGFVGLIAPHVARMLVGGDHKRVFPLSAFMGGIFVLWCDVAARMLFAPEEISVGIFTAIIGGPIFLWLLKKRRT